MVGRVAGEADPGIPRPPGQVLERALRVGDDVRAALEEPGGHEDAEAPTGRGLLKFEVAVDLVEGLDDEVRGCRLALPGPAASRAISSRRPWASPRGRSDAMDRMFGFCSEPAKGYRVLSKMP